MEVNGLHEIPPTTRRERVVYAAAKRDRSVHGGAVGLVSSKVLYRFVPAVFIVLINFPHSTALESPGGILDASADASTA